MRDRWGPDALAPHRWAVFPADLHGRYGPEGGGGSETADGALSWTWLGSTNKIILPLGHFILLVAFVSFFLLVQIVLRKEDQPLTTRRAASLLLTRLPPLPSPACAAR